MNRLRASARTCGVTTMPPTTGWPRSSSGGPPIGAGCSDGVRGRGAGAPGSRSAGPLWGAFTEERVARTPRGEIAPRAFAQIRYTRPPERRDLPHEQRTARRPRPDGSALPPCAGEQLDRPDRVRAVACRAGRVLLPAGRAALARGAG